MIGWLRRFFSRPAPIQPLDPPRCSSRKVEDKRSWRCTKDADHPGRHYSKNARRGWA